MRANRRAAQPPTAPFVATWGDASRVIENPAMLRIREGDLVPQEHEDGAALWEWVQTDPTTRRSVIAHVMNEQPSSTRRQRGMAAGQGVLKGYPDFVVEAPCRGWHGLRVELKRRRGSTHSPEQKAIQARLLSAGYLSVVACGWAYAACWIGWYLTGGRRDSCHPSERLLPAVLDFDLDNGSGNYHPGKPGHVVLDLAPTLIGEGSKR